MSSQSGSMPELRRAGGRCLAGPAVWAMCFVMGGCAAQGARKVPQDRFDYNGAIARSANEQMLLNLVRLRYSEVPVFLALNSVLTQYVWSGGVGVAGTGGENLGFPAWTVGGSADVRYIERPTMTYTPLSGAEFAAQLIAPVNKDNVFSLISSGWPPDQLLRMTIQRINGVGSAAPGLPGGADGDRAERFARMVELIIALARHQAIEVQREDAMQAEAHSWLVFADGRDAETQGLIDEFKDLTGLERGRTRFRVTTKIVGRAPDEVTIRVRSVLEMMGYLSAGVDVPSEDLEEGRAPGVAQFAMVDGQGVPMRVRWRRDRPDDAFVAVTFLGHWFYLPNSDHESKRAFGLLTYLYQMQATQEQGTAPLVTVPTG